MGALAAVNGGATDNFIMRICDVFMAIPGTLLAISICAALGTGMVNLIIAITIAQRAMAYAVENHNLVSNYALVEDGTVVNVIWLAEGNEGEFPGAVRLGDRPVAVGDTYDGEKFYHAGAEVLTPLEAAQAEAAAYKAALETLGVNTEEAADDAQ